MRVENVANFLNGRLDVVFSEMCDTCVEISHEILSRTAQLADQRSHDIVSVPERQFVLVHQIVGQLRRVGKVSRSNFLHALSVDRRGLNQRRNHVGSGAHELQTCHKQFFLLVKIAIVAETRKCENKYLNPN